MLLISAIVFLVWLAGLPGRIAIARKHPDAEAVNMMGWAGFLADVPWIRTFIWAFKPTDIVDIRRFPPEERQAIDEMIARLRGTAALGEAKGLGRAVPRSHDDGQEGHHSARGLDRREGDPAHDPADPTSVDGTFVNAAVDARDAEGVTCWSAADAPSCAFDMRRSDLHVGDK